MQKDNLCKLAIYANRQFMQKNNQTKKNNNNNKTIHAKGYIMHNVNSTYP